VSRKIYKPIGNSRKRKPSHQIPRTHALLISENHKPEDEIEEKSRTIVTKTTKNIDTEKEKRHRQPHRER
jgi:hypothetical protein